MRATSPMTPGGSVRPMPHVTAALLCDHAQIRDGLLFVLSGGITRIAVPQPEAPISFTVAGLIEVSPDERGQPAVVRFSVTSAITADLLWEATVEFTTPADDPNLFPGETTQLPFAIQVGPFHTPAPGPHDLKVSAGGDETELLTFYVLVPAPS